MSVQVDTTERGPGREFFELIASSKLISDRYLSDQNVGVIRWEFDYANRIIKDGQMVIFAESDKLDENMLPKRQARYAMIHLAFTPIGSAFGQNSQSIVRPVSPIAALVQNLQSDDATTRRNARDALVVSGPQVVVPIMAELRANPTDYRLRGGVIYVLSTMLNLHPDQKSSLSAALKGEDFPILVAAASDDDKSIRLQATECLYILGVPHSVNAARDTHDNNKASNQTSIVGQSSQQLSNSAKQNIINDIQRGPDPNNDLVGNSDFLSKQLGVRF
jgi:hypothetical protein